MDKVSCGILPYGEKILVRRLGEDKITSKGVVRSSSNKEKPLTVVVYGKQNIEGLSDGDKLLIARYSGMEFTYNDIHLLSIHEEDIIARLEEEK